MAYKLIDQNGYEININGMYKGTIIKQYKYNGMELYNVNYSFFSGNTNPFSGGYRRVKIGTSYYTPSGTTKRYVDAAYGATEIKINGKYSNSSYTNYEIYQDEILVSSGSFTSTLTDIYTITKTANTSIIISGEWDSTNSKFIYRITTNATIERSASYAYNNHEESYTYNVTMAPDKLTFPSLTTIKNKIKSATGKTVAKINSVKANLNNIYFHAYSAYGSSCIPYLNSVNSTTWTDPYIEGQKVGNKETSIAFPYTAWNITTSLSESSTKIFYGYYQDGTSSSRVYAMYPSTSESTRNYMCNTSSGSGNPVVALTIEYEYE